MKSKRLYLVEVCMEWQTHAFIVSAGSKDEAASIIRCEVAGANHENVFVTSLKPKKNKKIIAQFII